MNRRLFSQQYTKYHDRILASMTGMVMNVQEAEDITSAAFAKAFKRLPEFREESSFHTWLFAIARNEALSRMRKHSGVRFQSTDDPDTEVLKEPDLLNVVLERTECCQRLRRALRQVPGTYRRVLVGHFVRGRSVRTIARGEKVPLGTVCSRIFNAKRLLREAWEA